MRKKGFTLIELLVVISIIAVLMSIMMPALAKVRYNSHKVICGTRLKEQATALGCYAVDNKGRYPMACAQGCWPFGAMSYLPEGNAAGDTRPAGQAALIDLGYIKDPKFFYCPAAKRKDSNIAVDYQHDFYNKDLKGNWWEGAYVGYPYWAGFSVNDAEVDKKLNKLVAQDGRSPSDRITITDGMATKVTGGNWVESLREPAFSNHVYRGKLDGGNVLYNDSHIEWIKAENIIEDEDNKKTLRFVWPGTRLAFWL